MLVLSRKPNESIKIADNIEVHVLRVERGKVILGFDAPKEISIVRTEITHKCPKCERSLAYGQYDFKQVFVCPTCDYRKNINGEPGGQED